MLYRRSFEIEQRLENVLRLILTTLNKPEDFVLAVALIDAGRADVQYVRRPFTAEPGFKATSVNHELAELLAQAKELARKGLPKSPWSSRKQRPL